MSPQITKILFSAGLGLLMVGLFWLTYFLAMPFYSFFIGNVDNADLDFAATVRTSVYIILIVMSPQVWLFSTLYFIDRDRK